MRQLRQPSNTTAFLASLGFFTLSTVLSLRLGRPQDSPSPLRHAADLFLAGATLATLAVAAASRGATRRWRHLIGGTTIVFGLAALASALATLAQGQHVPARTLACVFAAGAAAAIWLGARAVRGRKDARR